jgi:hypothetical protein
MFYNFLNNYHGFLVMGHISIMTSLRGFVFDLANEDVPLQQSSHPPISNDFL